MSELVVITGAFAQLGFALAGIDAWPAGGPKEAQQLARRALTERARPFALAVEDDWLSAFDPDFKAQLDEDPGVLVAGIPPLRACAPGVEESYLAALMRRAIGVELHLGRG